MPDVLAFDIGGLRDRDLEWFEKAVSAERRVRAAKYSFLDDRKRCLAAGVLLRYAVSKRHGVPVRELDEAKGAYGKPFLPDHLGVHFNLSHAYRWVVCATSTNPVGVDIERVDDRPMGIARRFTPSEYAYVWNGPEEERPRRFTRIWTLKEACVKYVSLGLHMRLDSFNVSVDDMHPQGLDRSGKEPPFLTQAVHGDDYYVAKCCENDTALAIQTVPLEELHSVC
ncbi:4'-phosphopantetheinyl transferase family protein [Streptomyces sp. NPDC017520]|uniref:4'-phosphopantetheinyl transferase family protein n=1 Tax=Streptomyces sp. NPDC017520 TaxID=3364998 RepID=UPI00379A948E